MSNNVEDQIVSMQFDNRTFESGVATSLGTIDKLKGALSFSGAGQGLSDISKGVQNFNMSPMQNAVQGMSKTWLALTTVAVTAIANITNRMIDSGLRMAKSFTIQPILDGFHEYETNLNSIQTIMANTGKDVGTVNKYLTELNHYSDKTIYNFSEMARNIGTFTAAGVDLKTSTASIKGIANLAALSGSDANQASTAMYQLSQAIATGKVGLQDWNSVVNAGMGGKVFQQALANTAQAMGTINKGAVTLEGPMKKLTISGASFRDSIAAKPGEQSWLTDDVLVATLQQFTGDMSKATIMAQGFTAEQAKAILQTAKTAQKAATRVKTFTQLIDVVKESIGSGWSMIFQNLFGNFTEASKLWTGVSKTITGSVGSIFDSINKVLTGWRALGGYQDLWTGIGNVFKIIGNLIMPFVNAFKEILPETGKAGSGLAKATKGFADFTGFLVKATDKLNIITAPLGFVFRMIRTGVGYVAKLVGQLGPLLPILSTLAKYVGDLAAKGADIASGLIGGLLEGLNTTAIRASIEEFANNIVTWIKDTLGIHSPATTMVPIGINIVQGIVQGLNAGAQYLIGGLQKIFFGIGGGLKKLVENINFSDVIDVIHEGLFVALLLTFRNFVTTLTGSIGAFRDVLGRVGGVLDQMTDNLKTMQQKVKSEIIRNIAISVALLAASAILLSTVDGKKLGIALGAIGGLMISLVTAMKVLTGGKAGQLDGKAIGKQTAMLVGMGTAMIAFSTAIFILTGAVALMGQLDKKTIEKGLAGIAGVIAVITTSTAILSKTGGGATILATATALLIMSAALVSFAGTMKLYERLDWKTLVRGGGSAAAVIVAVGLALRAFGKGSVAGSASLVVASAALIVLAKAMQMFAAIGVIDMIKSVVALDFILASIATAAISMSAAEGGAGSMLVMSAAIIVLAKALEILGKIPLLDLVKGIGALVVVLAVIAGAALLLSPAVPLIAALGSAVLLLGLAALAAGVGTLAFATALGIIAVVGPAAFASLRDGIDDFLDLAPKIGEAAAAFVVGFITGIVKAGQPLVHELGKLVGMILDELAKLVPKGKHLLQLLINALIDVIAQSAERAGKAMIRLLLAMLTAIDNKIDKFINRGTDIIVSIIKGLGRSAKRIANATGRTLLDFLEGLDAAIVKYEQPIIEEGKQIAKHLVDGIVDGLLGEDALDRVGSAGGKLAGTVLGSLSSVWKVFSPSRASRELAQYLGDGIVLGIGDRHRVVEAESTEMAKKSLEAMRMTFKNSKNATYGLQDLAPKITPVLDLSQLARDANGIHGILGTPKIAADVSRGTARSIASRHAGSRSHDDVASGNTYNFNQVINSPKPVNHVKAYRGTKSQIALFKEATDK